MKSISNIPKVIEYIYNKPKVTYSAITENYVLSYIQ